MTDRIKMVQSDDDNSKFNQRPLAFGGPLKGTEEKGQKVLPNTTPQPGQETGKLIVPEMPLPSEPPAESD